MRTRSPAQHSKTDFDRPGIWNREPEGVKYGHQSLRQFFRAILPMIMPTPNLLTAEEFVEQRFDFPDNGRWMELVAGRPVELEPPNEQHGNVVLNFSKVVGEYMPSLKQGSFNFDLGIIVARDHDTVRYPMAAFFSQLGHFELSDLEITDLCPDLVVEVASTPERRRSTPDRILEYHELGVPSVWVIDTAETMLVAADAGQAHREFRGGQQLPAENILDGLVLTVEELFRIPEWWA